MSEFSARLSEEDLQRVARAVVDLLIETSKNPPRDAIPTGGSVAHVTEPFRWWRRV